MTKTAVSVQIKAYTKTVTKVLSAQFHKNNTQMNSLKALSGLQKDKKVYQTEKQEILYLTVVSFNTYFKAYFRRQLKRISQGSILMNSSTTNTTEIINSATTIFANSTTATLVHDMLHTSVTLLASETKAFNTTTAFPATTVQTVASFITAGNKNRATTIIVYPTVAPESVVIPIVSCIFGFPILAFLVICCLRRRAKLARERDRRRNYDNMQDHAVSLVRFSPIHRLNTRSTRAISLRPERSLSQGFTSLELDTVVEERCSDMEQTQTETLNAESPLETVSYKMSFSS